MKATVWKGDKLAGWLEATGNITKFWYSDEYLHSDFLPIATTLPKNAEVAIATHGRFPAFFSGLLPEGPQLEKLKKTVPVSDLELALLLEVGARTIGDVAVTPDGELPVHVPVFVDFESHSPRSFSEVRNPESPIDLWAIPGAQDKCSAAAGLESEQYGNGILKVSPPKFPALVENEFAMLSKLEAMEILHCGVEQFSVVHDAEGNSGLYVDRFDQGYSVEDACQLLSFYPEEKYLASFETLVLAVLDKVNSPEEALHDLAVQLAFAWLTGNGDLHAKNVSVVDKGSGFELSPVYDIPSTLPYGDTTLALTVAGGKDGLSRKKFTNVFKKFGLSEKVINQVADEVVKGTEDVADILTEVCELDGRRQRDVRRVLRNRRRTW